MKNLEILPPPDTPWAVSKNVLNEAGLGGDLHLLAPGAEKVAEHPSPGALVFFAVSGSITIASGLKNFILQPENTLHLPPGAKYALRNRDTALAKVLVLALPPPRPVRGPEELITLRA